MTSTGACEAFVSAPIKLAARINERGRRSRGQPETGVIGQTGSRPRSSRFNSRQVSRLRLLQTVHYSTSSKGQLKLLSIMMSLSSIGAILMLLLDSTGLTIAHQNQHPNNQLINHDDSTSDHGRQHSSLLRHHAHYLNFVPSAHFSYNEGRQVNGRSLELDASDTNSASLAAIEPAASSSHIYKRSSAVLTPAANVVGQPLIRQQPTMFNQQQQHLSARSALNPLSRRMMANGAPQLTGNSGSLAAASSSSPMIASNSGQQQARQPNWLGVGAPAASTNDHDHDLLHQAGRDSDQANVDQDQHGNAANNLAPTSSNQLRTPGGPGKRQSEHEAELLRQKQHIQYHDQWPSVAGKCHKRTLNFCASVLPFNTTTFPNIIGDTNRFEVKRSLPFFGFLAKSSCNKRLDELLCLLLEPPCGAHSGSAIPPCKKFCRLALEGCNEYIPATLALSSVFDCRQYPDSNDPNVCVNLAQGSKCAQDEFKCPDKTCIPRNWVCDGVRDCIFAADEANCTDSAALPQASVCSTEEFKCDGKCVPKAWKCDGERDCLDGSDEESCDLRPRCGPDRFKCADGNGCIPKRWVCDGKAECRDGSDEMNCNQRECSENDFKCDNGICIPKLWRCDRQFDCKDGSDERQCVYPTTTTTTTTTCTPIPDEISTVVTTTPSPATSRAAESVQLNTSSSYGIEPQVIETELSSETQLTNGELATSSGEANKFAQEQLKQQLEMSLSGDISRTIQHERDSSAAPQQPSTTTVNVDASSPSSVTPNPDAEQQHSPTGSARQHEQQLDGSSPLSEHSSNNQQQVALAKELKKFDYDLIPSTANMVQVNEFPVGQNVQQTGDNMQQKHQVGGQPMLTQIDFAPQQQQHQAIVGEQKDPVQLDQMMQHQLLRLNGFGAGPMAVSHYQQDRLEPATVNGPHQQQQQQQQQAEQPQQKVPIYRSLFKSLKGHHIQGQHRLQLDRNGGARNVVAIARRRRDRHQQHQAAEGARLATASKQRAMQQQVGDESVAGSQMGDSSIMQQQQQVGPTMMMPAQHHHHHHGQLNQPHQMANQTVARPAGAGPSEAGGSVASYLQLLNGRYNLRLPRVGAGGGNMVASLWS